MIYTTMTQIHENVWNAGGVLTQAQSEIHSTIHPVATVDDFSVGGASRKDRSIENGDQDVRVDGSYCSDMAVYT